MGVSTGAADAAASALDAPPGVVAWNGARTAVGRVVRGSLARLAAGAPARVFVVEGADAPGVVDELRLRHDVCLVDTPRSAMVLLVAGWLPAALHEAARRAHDAMAHPRATVWWARDPATTVGAPFPAAAPLWSSHSSDPLPDLAVMLVRVQGELLRGTRASEPALLPDVDPAPWRGVGPYGQGGSGMTGGVPYGRPMAGRAPDRDGLELDQLPVRVGPFFAPFPPGLVLDVKLQGDVVQEVVVPGNAFATAAGAAGGGRASAATGRHAGGHATHDAHAMDGAAYPSLGARGDGHDPFRAALVRPVPVADLERARARHHLRWLAHALRVHGLGALARRALGLAGASPAAAGDVAALGRLLERTRALGWATAGVGVTTPDLVAGRGLGPVARAAGLVEDARLEDLAYQALGFEPFVTSSGDGDARARWRQRLGEAIQSLGLAARAGAQRTGGDDAPVEGPRGTLRRDATDGAPSSRLLALLPDLLRDGEWGDAVTTVVSLDVDVREAAPGAAPLAPPPLPKTGGGKGGMGSGMGAGGDEHAHHGHGGGMG